MTLSEQQTALAREIRERGTAGFDDVMGLRYVTIEPDTLVAQFEITDRLRQPYGITHGGVYCAVIESVASMSALLGLDGEGHVVGVNNNTNFIRSLTEGVLTARSTPVHRGRTQQVWRVEITDEGGRLVAEGQVRVHNVRAGNPIDNVPAPPAD